MIVLSQQIKETYSSEEDFKTIDELRQALIDEKNSNNPHKLIKYFLLNKGMVYIPDRSLFDEPLIPYYNEGQSNFNIKEEDLPNITKRITTLI